MNRRKATCLSLPGCTMHCKRARRQVCTPGSSVDLSMMLSRHPFARQPGLTADITRSADTTCGLHRYRVGTSRFQKRAKHPDILQRSRVQPRLLTRRRRRRPLCHLAIFTLATNERRTTGSIVSTMF